MAHLTDYTLWPRGIYCWDARMFKTCKSINVIQDINKIKIIRTYDISKDTANTFDKVHHPFMIKSLNPIGIELIYTTNSHVIL